MAITASRLREDIYKILDQAIESGQPVEITRKGTVLHIVPEKRISKLDNLRVRTVFIGDSDEIASMEWSSEWSEAK